MKKLLSIFILIVASTIISAESWDVVTVGEGAEIKVSLVHGYGRFDINLTISNTSDKTIVLYDDYFTMDWHIGFQKSNGELLDLMRSGILWLVDYSYDIGPDSLAFIEPGESVHYTTTFECYSEYSPDNSLRTFIPASGADLWYFDKYEQVYFVIRYEHIPPNIDEIKATTNEYLVEPFEIKFPLNISEIAGEKVTELFEGDFEYTVQNEKATITEHIGWTENLVIPEKLGGYEVIRIGSYPFLNESSLKTVEIPNSVISIEDRAFWRAKSLISVKMGNSVTSIGNDAFAECSGLETIEIPDSVTSIGDRAFEYCESLTAIEIPDSVRNIGSNAFAYCENLTSVKIGNSVTNIGENTFWGSNNVTLTIFEGSYAHEYAIENDIDYVIE